MQAIQSQYPMFFKDGTLNAAALKDALSSSDNSPKARSLRKKAIDTVKSLYVADFKLVSGGSSALLKSESIAKIKQHGERIISRGVEEAKGGIANLLLIAIAGKVTVPAESWGLFVDGPPDISPLCHGPYYLIASTMSNQEDLTKDLNFAEVRYVLVPFPEQVEELTIKATKLQEQGLMSPEQATVFCKKLIDYQSFSLTLAEQAELQKGKPRRPKAQSPSSKRLPLSLKELLDTPSSPDSPQEPSSDGIRLISA